MAKRNTRQDSESAPRNPDDGDSGDADPENSGSPLDETIQIESDPHETWIPVYPGHRPGQSPATDPQRKTTLNIRDVSNDLTIFAGSIMTSADIQETVNPRELSDRDAALWNDAVGDSEPDSDPPPINRTFSERQFDRLRQCNVASVKSDPEKSSDYRLVRKLGEGGMGDVYVARQGSLDRLLALKLIKPLSGKKREQLLKNGSLDAIEADRRQQFLSEAIVTGDLDHPNIVPIHDVALTSANELFYSMKRVVGTPWSDVIRDKTRDENLEILLKTADAIGHAHTRGVVHRDIKPENIMLGDFGVVMVMDWGLALPTSQYEKQNSIFATSGLGGTPAFMAPEMATGPLEKIGPASDIYLLGATLFMIITGEAPHHAQDVTACLKAVRSNQIREVPEAQHGELLDISLKAMASKPEDRYPDVESFQKAVRDYRSHAESISLASRAADDLALGEKNQSYSDLSRAAFRFEEAIKCWEGNEKARRGLAATKWIHANVAYANEDFDLGLSLLQSQVPEHQPIFKKLRDGIQERESRAARLSLLRKVAVAMLAFIIVGGSVAMLVINHKRQEAQDARNLMQTALQGEKSAKEIALAAATSEKAAKEQEVQERQKATRAALVAAQKQQEAEVEREKAVRARAEEALARKEEAQQRLKAEQAQQLALTEAQRARDAKEAALLSQQRAEYEEYVSKIGLAKARLERNEVDGAREILGQLQDKSPQSVRNWEWRWLWRQANQSMSSQPTDAAVIDLSIAPRGRRAVVALSNGKVDWVTLSDDGRLTGRQGVAEASLGGARATSVAVSPDEQSVAIGTSFGDIVLLTAQERHVLHGHDKRVNDLQFTRDGLLVSGSSDQTVRVWQTKSRTELTRQGACWHISPVKQVAVAESATAITLAVATADDSTGQVALWKLSRQGDSLSVQRAGTFTEHAHPVSSVAISTDGALVASGDAAGNVLLWDPATVPSIDYSGSIQRAVARIDGNRSHTEADAAEPNRRTTFSRFVDSSLETERRLVSTQPAPNRSPCAHQDLVETIRFSNDGMSLLTSSDDYTLKRWDVSTRRLNGTLKGHGGWVVGAEFLQGNDQTIVSASNDATLRSWSPATYIGAFVVNQSDAKADPPIRQTQAHGDDIWSASFSADGRKVVTASNDHTARVMEIDKQTLSFKEVVRLEDEVLSEGTSFVAMSLRVDQPHQRLMIGGADATIRIWDLERGTEIGRAAGTGLNRSFAVSNDGRLMLTGSSLPNTKAILWELDTTGPLPPRIIHRLMVHDQAVTAFAISPDSKRLFTGDRSGFGIVWDAATGKQLGLPVEELRGFRINAASFSVDGRELLIAADDQQLTRMDLHSRQRIARLPHEGFVTDLSLSADGRHALTVSDWSTETSLRSAATLWDLSSGQGQVLDRVDQQRDDQSSSASRDRPRITSAQFDAAGKVAVVSRAAIDDQPGSLKRWSVDDVASSMKPADRTLTAGQLESTHGLNQRTSPSTFSLPAILGTAEVVLPIDDRTILSMNKNAAFKWDLATTQLIRSYRAHAELTEASFSPDGSFVATASRSVKIWDAATGVALAKLESPHIGPVRSVQFSPVVNRSEYLFATGGDDGVAQTWRWDAKTLTITKLTEFAVENGARIRRVRFSPLGDRLFVVGNNGSAKLWNLTQPTSLINFSDQADESDFMSAAFSEDGSCVAAGGTDHKVRIWSIPNPGEPPAQPVVLIGHADTVNDLVLMGTDRSELRVMTASSDDTARVWDPRLDAQDEQGNHLGAREIMSIRRHVGDVTAVDITDDGNLLMTAGRDGAVILWPADIPSPGPVQAAR